MDPIRFDNRVAIITGAGGGLGREYALLLASRGAKVVVNDLGCSPSGEESSESMADRVVNEIREKGGEAVASYDGVDSWEGGERIVQTAIDAYGKLDILINNAGILRDRTIVKMTEEEFLDVIRVHLIGSWYVSRAAMPRLRENNYGRILMTSSGAGLWGNYGQTNYSAAKLGLVGMMHALKLEGQKYNILVNTISPIAASRLLGSIMTDEMMKTLDPHFVAVASCYLVSEQDNCNGEIILAGGGKFQRAQLVVSEGVRMGEDEAPTMEWVAEHLDQICDMSEARGYFSSLEKRDKEGLTTK